MQKLCLLVGVLCKSCACWWECCPKVVRVGGGEVAVQVVVGLVDEMGRVESATPRVKSLARFRGAESLARNKREQQQREQRANSKAGVLASEIKDRLRHIFAKTPVLKLSHSRQELNV